MPQNAVATTPTTHNDARMLTKFGFTHGGVSGYFMVFAAFKLLLTVLLFGGAVLVNMFMHDMSDKGMLALCVAIAVMLMELALALLYFRVRYVAIISGAIALILGLLYVSMPH